MSDHTLKLYGVLTEGAASGPYLYFAEEAMGNSATRLSDKLDLFRVTFAFVDKETGTSTPLTVFLRRSDVKDGDLVSEARARLKRAIRRLNATLDAE